MLIDARELPQDATLRTDICIVGAGPAGLTLAKRLEGQGLGVMILEAGGEGIDPATDDLLLGEVTNPEYPLRSQPYPLQTTRAKGVGGSSLRWTLVDGWRARPLDPIDFEKREGVPHSGWPIGFENLRRYYKRAREFCGLDSEHDEVGFWANGEDEDNLLIDEGGVASKIFFRSNRAQYTELKDDFAQSEALTLVTFANVMTLESTANATVVNAARAKTLAGNELRVEAATFVLAAGGIDNARVLLESNGAAPNGLGNDHDLVGRYFMEHPHVYTGLLELDNRIDAERMGFYTSLRRHASNTIEGMLSLDEEVLRRHALPNAGFWVRGVGVRRLVERLARGSYELLFPRPSERSFGQRLENVVGDLGHLLDVPRQRGLHRLSQNNLFQLYCESEQVPNPESRVTLSERTDSLGARRVRLDWQLKPEDFDTIRRSQEVLSQRLQAIGVGRLRRLLGDETPRASLGIGNHQIGTTRMSDEPRKGVVDRDGRVHGVENLYVAGASVFPTGGAANPTLTVIALALRLGDTLIGRHA